MGVGETLSLCSKAMEGDIQSAQGNHFKQVVHSGGALSLNVVLLKKLSRQLRTNRA
jgi:hypothetical protein